MNRRILVVEDHEDNRKIMRDLLIHANYEVLEALSGDECVTKAQTHAPDVIVMDMRLPGIDGYEATRQIRNSQPDRRVPIIAVTAHALSGDREKALEAGCDAFFAKPVDTRALLAKIQFYTS